MINFLQIMLIMHTDLPSEYTARTLKLPYYPIHSPGKYHNWVALQAT